MSEASYAQTAFLGGEISKWAQGRYDTPRYKMALAQASNIIISDEGAATRRPGFRFLGTTRNGAPGRLLPFDFAEASPYNMEFTDGFLRFWNGLSLVTTNDKQSVASITNASPAVFTLGNTVSWQTGDEIYFNITSPFQAALGGVLLNRQFTITMLTTSTFTVADSVTGQAITGSMLDPQSVDIYPGAISTSSISSGPIGGTTHTSGSVIPIYSLTVNHINQIATPYTVAGADWHTLRSVQGLELAMLLHGAVSPQALQVTALPTSTAFASFSFAPASFQDGPYLDPPSQAIATPSATTGVIQVTIGYPAYNSGTTYGVGVKVTASGVDYVSLLNNNTGNTPVSSPTKWAALSLGSSISPSGFVATDVGRMIRLFSAPPNWSAATTYAAGNTVTYNGSYFTSLINSNTNNEPDISLTDWVINPSGALYSWGTITSIVAANIVDVQIQGLPLLYTTPCPSFRIGAWSNTTGWPTCGCYQGGRFWFAGAIPNRVDSSSSDQPFVMSPTNTDGTVVDSNAITYTFNSNSVDQIFWMEPQVTGILVGTQKGEYVLSSGGSGAPFTPSNISESPASKYGSANTLPVKTGLSMCFIQRYTRRLLEYLADVFSNRFYGPDLTTFVKHIGKRTFQELAYQHEPVPVVWSRMGDGSLTGTTYRRISLFSNQEPEFNAWHQHPIGSGRVIESICVGPSTNGALDTLATVTNDPSTNVRFVENLTTMLEEDDPITNAWFVDSGVVPGAATVVSYGSPLVNYVRFYGTNYFVGKTVSVFAAGLDCGDYVVTQDYIDVPLGTLDPISGYTFDIPQFNILQPMSSTFSQMSVAVVDGTTLYNIPCVIGFNYQSKGQLCRPMLAVDAGSKNGPGFAKKKRTARYGINLVDSLGVFVGTDTGPNQPVPTVSPSGKLMPYLSTFTGIKRETLKNDFSFDSMLYWETSRPLPATVINYGGFITTEDV